MEEINNTQTENTDKTRQCNTSNDCKCRLSLIMNLILFAGLVVLYILYFMDKKSEDINLLFYKKATKPSVSDMSIPIRSWQTTCWLST